MLMYVVYKFNENPILYEVWTSVALS